MTENEGDGRGRRDNGLEAISFVALAEVDAELADMLLSALGRAKIAAYLEPTPDPGRLMLYAATPDRVDARTIVTTVWRAAGADANAAHDGVTVADALVNRDTDAEFRALTSDWHVDTVAAIRSAERDLNREDSDWRARIGPPPSSTDDVEDHFVPPPPPPLPRLSASSVGAIAVIALGIVALATGHILGIGTRLTLLAGIGGILLGAGMLMMKLHAEPEEDDDDDGAIL